MFIYIYTAIQYCLGIKYILLNYIDIYSDTILGELNSEYTSLGDQTGKTTICMFQQTYLAMFQLPICRHPIPSHQKWPYLYERYAIC